MSEEKSESANSILVIDDEKAVTGVIATVLEKEGYTVHVAHSGTDGLEKAKEVVPDLIFMDISMPDMDGYTVTESIKANPALSGIPVIFLSGRSESEDGGRAFAKGGLTFLKKPFTNQQIRDLVALALETIS